MPDINQWLERKYANMEAQTATQAATSMAAADAERLKAQAYMTNALRPDPRTATAPAAAINYASQIPLPQTDIAPSTTSTTLGASKPSLLDQSISARQWTPIRLGETLVRRAEGGVIPQTNQNPLYQSYLKSMARANMQDKAMPEETFMRSMAQLDAQRRMAMANQTNMGGTMGYAQGGAVDVGGMQVLGPGHGKSDSIPAVIDGQRFAALSTGEFVFPKKVVDYYGTKFLDAMVSKARQALKEKQYA